MTSSVPIQPVILSGGAGSRLWPLSRSLYPKQFQRLVSEATLLQATAQRVSTDRFSDAIVVCNEEHRFIVAEQIRAAGLGLKELVLEPVGRDTAPAITVAALCARDVAPEDLILILPSDHIIDNAELFRERILDLSQDAQNGKIVAFGIPPRFADPELGYIKTTDAEAGTDSPATAVQSFIEKPDIHIASDLIRDGYSWYSGIALFRPDAFLAAMDEFAPDILLQCRLAWDGRESDHDFTRIAQEPYYLISPSSAEEAVMTRSQNIVMAPLDSTWQDVRTWTSVRDSNPKDSDGNVTIGNVVTMDSRNSIIHSEHHLTALLGINDVCVAASDDAILVSSTHSADKVDEIVTRLDTLGSTRHTHHTKIYRPWGSYHLILLRPQFQVKELVINPGAALSLQKHAYRAEHWVVVEGTASVTRNDEDMLLHENEAVYIPIGAVHRLANRGKIPLHVIEVQSGPYLGEDDVIRLNDTDGRN